jgi:hypothetical protein
MLGNGRVQHRQGRRVIGTPDLKTETHPTKQINVQISLLKPNLKKSSGRGLPTLDALRTWRFETVRARLFRNANSRQACF